MTADFHLPDLVIYLSPFGIHVPSGDTTAVQDLTQFISAGLGRAEISLVPAWQSACGACCLCCLVMNWVL